MRFGLPSPFILGLFTADHSPPIIERCSKLFASISTALCTSCTLICMEIRHTADREPIPVPSAVLFLILPSTFESEIRDVRIFPKFHALHRISSKTERHVPSSSFFFTLLWQRANYVQRISLLIFVTRVVGYAIRDAKTRRACGISETWRFDGRVAFEILGWFRSFGCKPARATCSMDCINFEMHIWCSKKCT